MRVRNLEGFKVAISRIVVRNFKSFQRIELDLTPFSVIVGANESGKSNLISVLRFVRDITAFNLRDAISIQGGLKYLRNMSIGPSDDLFIETTMQPRNGETLGVMRKKRDYFSLRTNEVVYGFALRFKKRGPGFQISSDYFRAKFSLSKFDRPRVKDSGDSTPIWSGEGSIRRSRAKINLDVQLPKEAPFKKDDIFPLIGQLPVQEKTLLCEQPFYFRFFPSGPLFSDIGIYDFDPKLPKKAVPVSGRAELEEGGGNLALVLRNIIESGANRRKVVNLVHDLLPFVEDTRVERLTDKSVLFTIREKYFAKQYLPASLVSDGTIAVTALIVALYFENKSIVAIEEAERNIHPYLIPKLVEIMKEASKRRQIIVTTHNPELVRQAGIENLRLVSRDKNGFSNVTRPAEKPEIKSFLENEIGVEELYAKNLLEM